MAAFVKSIFYLGGFSALGYVLMKLTEPDTQKLEQIKRSSGNPQSAENRRKTELIIQKLKESANIKDKPSSE